MRPTLPALALAATLLAVAPATALAGHAPDPRVDLALDWLAAQQLPDGHIGAAPHTAATAWSAIAFARGGRDPGAVMVPGGASLEAALIADTTPALDANGLARQVLALVASGADPRTAAGFDAVAELRSRFDGTQVGRPALVNDDIFALQALHAAGVPDTDPVVQGARAFVLGQQQPSGAWSFGAFHPGNPDLVALTFADVDTTGQALVALLATGSAVEDLSIQRGVLFLHLGQTLDGGCTWSPLNYVYGWSDPAHLGQGNADSTAWAIMGVLAAGQDPAGDAWRSPTGATLDGFLGALQLPTGQVLYQTNAPGFSPLTTTAFAAVALSGHTFAA